MSTEPEITNPENTPPVVKRSKFAQLILDRDIKLTETKKDTGISYPTLIDIKMGRKKKYRPRTKRDLAAYFDVAISDIFDDEQDTSDAVTPFEKLLKEINKDVRDAEQATGISYPILQQLKNGEIKNYRPRTLQSVADWFSVCGLEVKPEDLLPKEGETKSTKK